MLGARREGGAGRRPASWERTGTVRTCLWAFALVSCVACSTHYTIHLESYPPVAGGEVWIGGEKVGETDLRGQADVESGRMSIFASPMLELRAEEERGQLKLDFTNGTKIRNVGKAVITSVGFDRIYDVLFTFLDKPLLPFSKDLSGDRRIWVRNRGAEAVWAGARDGDAGQDLLIRPGETGMFFVSEGSYQVLFVSTADPSLEETVPVRVGSEGARIEVPASVAGEVDP